MDQELQSNVAETVDLKSWWENLAFEGKQYCIFSDNHDLLLKPTAHLSERILLNITQPSESTLAALTAKFIEVKNQVTELDEEWQKAEDKSKLFGKIARNLEYLNHAVAIGDYEPLFENLTEKNNYINTLSEANYSIKLELTEKIEALATQTPSKEHTEQLKQLTEEWKNAGFLDKKRNELLWNRIETAKENFFNLKRTFLENQEKEMLINLDLKMELVEKAEQLAHSENWKSATEGFKNLMEEWKKTGRTVASKNELLWQKFIGAQNIFFERKRAHFDIIQTEQEGNIGIKEAIVANAEAMSTSTEWNKTTLVMNELTEAWKNTGRVPNDKSEELWNRFNSAKDIFFNNKRKHFQTLKINQVDNIAKKTAIIKHAEEIKGSSMWRETTTEFNELLEEWKKTGRVGKEQDEALWKQFSEARNYFFERKDADWAKRQEIHEKIKGRKADQNTQFLKSLYEELQEEEERLVDLKNSLNNLGNGPKDDQIKANLEQLIPQCEQNIIKKKEKIASVEQQTEK